MSKIQEFVNKYEPYLKDFDFSNEETHRRLELQKINPESEVIERRIAELKGIIARNILNINRINKFTFKYGKKTYKGFVNPDNMKFISLYVGYNELLESKKESVNPYPQIFVSTDVYNKFLTYTKKHIIDTYQDYGYLFQRLKHEKLIYDMKQKTFIDWLFEYGYINEKELDNIIIKECFYTLIKSSSAQRENNFNNVFDL
jgi:hypothetical protein